MEANQIIDMTDATVKFCVSWVTTQVPSRLLLTLFNLGIAIVFLAGHACGIPNNLLARILSHAVPSTEHAVRKAI